MTDMFLATDAEGYIGCCEAVRDMDHRALLPKITAPTLVIAGRHDPATTVETAEYIREQHSRRQLIVLDAAHISNVEQPQAYTEPVLGFLKKYCKCPHEETNTMDDKERYERGMRARRKVLGDAWVDAPTPDRPPSTPNSRTSSPATPGARSGRARTSTSARAAFW